MNLFLCLSLMYLCISISYCFSNSFQPLETFVNSKSRLYMDNPFKSLVQQTNDSLFKVLNFEEWWYDPRIHTFGNIGLGGWIHAFTAPMATKIIDIKAYDGRDIRSEISKLAIDYLGKDNVSVIADFGSGSGFSTIALYNHSNPNTKVYGLDTSYQMITMSNIRQNGLFTNKKSNIVEQTIPRSEDVGITYEQYNVANDNYFKLHISDNSVDIVTCYYLFHEAPKDGHALVLENAYRILKPGGIFVFVDISLEYMPSFGMLMGEPYVLDYQKTIVDTLKNTLSTNQPNGFKLKTYLIKEQNKSCQIDIDNLLYQYIPGHVIVGILEK